MEGRYEMPIPTRQHKNNTHILIYKCFITCITNNTEEANIEGVELHTLFKNLIKDDTCTKNQVKKVEYSPDFTEPISEHTITKKNRYIIQEDFTQWGNRYMAYKSKKINLSNDKPKKSLPINFPKDQQLQSSIYL